MSLRRNIFSIVFMLILIMGILIPVISLSSNQVSSSQVPASTDPWASPGYSNCAQCHTTGIPAVSKFNASMTINPTLCRRCHDTVDYGPLSMDPTVVHASHLGLTGAQRPAAGSSGTITKHPVLSKLVNPVTTDFGTCQACHRSLSGGEAGMSCTACHDPATATHISSNINSNCSTCHGALPTITYHGDIGLSGGNHSILGSGLYGCFVCHNNQTTGISGYRLANGTVISASNPSQTSGLCWQCHSDYYTLWIAGKHGDPTKQCTDPSCHNPHAPYITPTAAVTPTPSILSSSTFIFGAAIIIVIIIAVAIYLLSRRKKIEAKPPQPHISVS